MSNRYRYLIHDRDNIFVKRLYESIWRLGLKVLKSPLRSPKANAICERAICTISESVCTACHISYLKLGTHIMSVIVKAAREVSSGTDWRAELPPATEPERNA